MFASTIRRQLASKTARVPLRFPQQLPRRLASTETGSTASQSSSSTFLKYLRQASLISSLAFGAYTFGSLYPPTLATYISPRIAPPPPDPDHPSSIAYISSLEDTLQNLSYLADLRSQSDADEWYETRPYVSIPKEHLQNSLTAGALRGPGKLGLPPLVRSKKDESESIIIMHVGTGLCGHEGVVHGGLLATVLDEALGRIAILNLPERIAVTATLSLNYRAPTRADQFIVIKTRVDEVKGRKAKVSGLVQALDGTALVEANALFVQPRYAKMLNKERIEKFLGMPPSFRITSDAGSVDGAPVAPKPATLS